MNIIAIKTHRVTTQDSLPALLDRYVTQVNERDVLVVTSKILGIMEGQLISKNDITKQALIEREADAVLAGDEHPYGLTITIKNGMLIPSAGIDESNVDNCYVLYPRDIMATAQFIWKHLRHRNAIHDLGVVITDSHTTIMRRGVTGIAVGWCGFEPLYSYVGKPDIYGRALKVTQLNLLDSLATAAVFVMGEGDEQTPMARILHAPKMVFLDRPPTLQECESIKISLEEDLYGPLMRGATWIKKNKQ